MLRRFPQVAFGALVVATVGAFFVTQHLKVTTPLIARPLGPSPAVINPYGTSWAACGGMPHNRTVVSFYLQHRSDDVSVYVVNQNGDPVRTLASGVHINRQVRTYFTWNGKQDNGAVAPDGVYYIRVALLQQGRTVNLTDPAGQPRTVRIRTIPPRPVVTAVTAPGARASAGPVVISPPGAPVVIHYAGDEHRSGIVRIYRTDLPGKQVELAHFTTGWNKTQTRWNGLQLDGTPAPQGTYLVGLQVTDAACNTGSFPITIPPPAGTTPHDGISVVYLVAQPPLTPVPAGSTATVYVDAEHNPFHWTLWRAGARRPTAHGSQRSYALRVKLPPAQDAGLYHVVLDWGTHRTDVPLIADHPGTQRIPRVLVVLPALTWQGLNPRDDDGDGMPDTLDAGYPVGLERPLLAGLPGDYYDEAALLAYLDHANLRYDLTTDVALLSGSGPSLAGHAAVVLAGAERWFPASLANSLRGYVQAGGHVVSFGVDSMLRSASVRATAHGLEAAGPTAPASTDALGARPGALVSHSNLLITVIRDGLGIFSTTSGAFQGYSSFQPFSPLVAGKLAASAAGAASTTPAIIGYQLGHGAVVEVGLVGFGTSLASNVDAQEFIRRVWSVLGR